VRELWNWFGCRGLLSSGQVVITYPKNGKTGLQNILADDFVEATQTGDKLFEYAVNAEVPVGAGLKIIIKTKSNEYGYDWGGFYPDFVENWKYTYYDNVSKSNTFTVYESGKRAEFRVIFGYHCIIEFYENGAKTPTKVKEIKVKK